MSDKIVNLINDRKINLEKKEMNSAEKYLEDTLLAQVDKEIESQLLENKSDPYVHIVSDENKNDVEVHINYIYNCKNNNDDECNEYKLNHIILVPEAMFFKIQKLYLKSNFKVNDLNLRAKYVAWSEADYNRIYCFKLYLH